MLPRSAGDATARIWDLRPGVAPGTAALLPHASPSAPIPENAAKDVTTLDWADDGSLLATGFCDGCARVWRSDGACPANLSAALRDNRY